MISVNWDEFWWERITGPQAVVTDVVNFLLDKSMVILDVPDDLPWRHGMRSSIEKAFKMKSETYETIIQTIDASDDWSPAVEPGRYLLQRFATNMIQTAYREKSGTSIQNYIIRNAVLKNTIVWVKGLTAAQFNQWLNFCRGYSPNTLQDGLIVLEVHGAGSSQNAGRTKTVRFSDKVSNYDLQLFSNFVLSERPEYDELWKQYVSTVASRLCEIDAEITEHLLRIIDFTAEEPLAGIQQLAALPEYGQRGQGNNQHVLACARGGNTEELGQRIWSAQLQVLFPLIEFERLQLIKELYPEIQRGLTDYEIVQYRQRITDPLDIELGTLVYCFSHYDDGGRYFIHIPKESVRERIRFLHQCRNLLAHTSFLSVEQVKELIDGQPHLYSSL